MNLLTPIKIFWRPAFFLCLLGLWLAGSKTLLLAQNPTPDPRFGLVQTFDDFPAAAESGAGYTRIKLYWDIIQPDGPDSWAPSNVPDPLLEADLAAGRQVVGLIVRTPAWAADPTNPANDPQHPSAKDVPQMDAWAAFVRKLVKQYRGRIHHWIIWNEPDVWDPNHPGSTWNGSEDDFIELHKTAYFAIKSVDPSMKVYLTGLTYWWDDEYDREQYLERLLRRLKADPDAAKHNYYFDGVNYHLYYKPHQIYDVLTDIRALLNRYGFADKAIWLNETNAPPSSDPQEPPHREPRFKASLEEQAAFMLQVHAMAFAAGAERVQVYKLYNSTEHPEDVQPFGLLRGDKSRRPAFDSYKLVTKYLGGFESVRLFEQGDVAVVIFKRPADTVSVIWNWAHEPRHATLNAIASQAQLIDQAGHATTLQAERGKYTLDLPAAPCTDGACFIGGLTFLIVEPGLPDQRNPLAVVPTVTPTPTPIPNPVQVLAVSPRRQSAFWGIYLMSMLAVGGGLWWFWRRN
ncbi:MAG: hypothetical protein D6768_11275 [Chloroflexi bacterium]|nr:MAG: hypothetical protein D6768_11275 [Chloroflexota bacterium]